jgi:hypothetical protein
VGTSTIHDWKSEVENVKGSTTFELENGMVISIPQIAIAIKAESIESGKSKMNSITYESLKQKNSPTYFLSSPK